VVVLTGQSLTLDEVVRVARGRERVEIHADSTTKMLAARAVVEHHLQAGTPVYGMTTGVAARKRNPVLPEAQEEHNRLLIEALLVGQGPDVSEEIVRATILRLVNGFTKGSSGVRPVLAERLVDALNDEALPRLALYGSVGMGDIVPMAELGHALLGDLTLAAKEAVSLVDNDAFATAIAALAIHDYGRLLDAFDAAGALDLEAFAANLSILHAAVGRERPYPGLQTTIARLRDLLEGSSLWSDDAARNLQDPLSFRCLPQVHAAAREALGYAESQLAIELNASQENPLLVRDENLIFSVGNFDPLVLACALDFLRIALAPVITSGCERLIKLMQARFSGLVDGLSRSSETPETTFPHLPYVAAALTGEARLLAQPVSYELPSTTIAEGIEDRMTFAPLAARRLAEMVALGERVVALELIVGARAVEVRAPERLGTGAAEIAALVRGQRASHGAAVGRIDVEPVVELVRSGSLSRVGRTR
jgi:histidine ammonia-lyase